MSRWDRQNDEIHIKMTQKGMDRQNPGNFATARFGDRAQLTPGNTAVSPAQIIERRTLPFLSAISLTSLRDVGSTRTQD